MLHEILKFLSQPLGWFSTTFSIIMGMFVGFIGKFFVDDFGRRYVMRRVLYIDLAQMFFAVEMTMNEKPSPIHSDTMLWRQGQFRDRLFFHGEQYCLSNPEIYIQLRERFASMTLYQRFHKILDDPADAVLFNAEKTTRIFALYVQEGVLRRIYFRWFLRWSLAKNLLRKIDDIRTQNEEFLKHIYDKAKANGSIDSSTVQ